ncbi:MAG: hypothetical protein ACP5NZ_04350 [Nanobdellota archaeon]
MAKTIENKAKEENYEDYVNGDFERKELTFTEVRNFLNLTPRDYRIIYPGLEKENYCPGEDLLLEHGNCQKMVTAMNPLRKGIRGFPKHIMRVNGLGRYKTGEVWVDDRFNIAYLYLGKLPDGRDVVYNLGGETSKWKTVQAGYINKTKKNEIFFDRRVFPKR